jgi:hypothetical protein
VTTLVNFSSPSGSDGRGEWRTAAKRALLFALWASVVATGRFGLAQTPTLYVIGGPGVTLSGAEVKEVYQGDKVFSGSVRLVPVDNAASREAFLSKVMGMTASKYESVWTKKAFRDALNPPNLLSTDAQVVEFVKRTIGAVGYVSTPPSGVTIIQKF